MKKRKLFLAMLLICAVALSACGKKKAEPVEDAPVEEEAAAEETAAEEEAPAEEVAEEAEAEEAPEEEFDPNPANEIFSITIPDEFVGKVEYEITEDSISVYDKESKEAGFGGHAFTIRACDDMSEYGFIDKKIGELTTGEGDVYDMVLAYPTDVQYDPMTNNGQAPETFAKLYDGAAEIAKGLVSVDGGSYADGAGTKGEDLYQAEVAKVAQAIEEHWDAVRLEEEGLSSMYYAMYAMGEDDVASKIGYAYADVNADGIDELLIGEIGSGAWQDVVYDIFTIADKEPVHVTSGWSRNRYYVAKGGMLVNEYSGGAAMSGMTMYSLEHNSATLAPQIALKVDEYENEEQPWFVSYGVDFDEDKWEPLTEDEYKEYRERFTDLVYLDYKPFTGVEAAAPEEAEEEAEAIGMPNPWKDVTIEEAQKAVTPLFSIPEGAENVAVTMMEDPEAESPLVQVNFTLDGMDFIARAQNNTEEKYIDGIGMYYDWTVQEEKELKDWAKDTLTAKFSRYLSENENVDLCTWYDEAAGCGYSLSVASDDLEGFDIMAVVEAMKP